MASASIKTETPPTYLVQGLNKLEIDVTFSDDNSFTTADLDHKIEGFLIALETNPDGTTAPTASYDITLVDDEGLDVLQGAGADRHNTNTEMAAIALGTYFHPPVTRDQTLALTISGNSVASAKTKIIIYYLNVNK